MATDVIMPQMGESIAEGTLTRWLVQVGETVERDQPLFEISTDKVDAEIPSPSAGTLLEVKFSEGDVVQVNDVVAVVGGAGETAEAVAEPEVRESSSTAEAAAASHVVEPAPTPPPPSVGQVEESAAGESDLIERVRRFFERYDVLALPTSQVPPFDVELDWPRTVDGEPMETYIDWMRSCSDISTTGCPAVSMPAGFTPEGLPVGVQFVGPPRSDVELLRFAGAWESAEPVGERRATVGGS